MNHLQELEELYALVACEDGGETFKVALIVAVAAAVFLVLGGSFLATIVDLIGHVSQQLPG